jgi:hypothetical protein
MNESERQYDEGSLHTKDDELVKSDEESPCRSSDYAHRIYSIHGGA